MGNGAAKAAHELAAFEEFVKHSRLAIDPTSVEKREGDKVPDIWCRDMTEGPLAFELSRIVAEDVAQLAAAPDRFEDQFVWTSDSTARVLRNKLDIAYVADCPIELLLYTDGRVVTQDELIVETMRAILQCRNGVFRRVWFMSKDGISEVWSAS